MIQSLGNLDNKMHALLQCNFPSLEMQEIYCSQGGVHGYLLAEGNSLKLIYTVRVMISTHSDHRNNASLLQSDAMVATNREANSGRHNLGILPVWGCK